MWPSAILKAVMDLDLLRFLTDIFLFWTDNFKSLDSLRVSRRSGCPFSDRMHRLSLPWSASLQGCAAGWPGTGCDSPASRASAEPLLLWQDSAVRERLRCFRLKPPWAIPNWDVAAAGPNSLFFFFYLEFCWFADFQMLFLPMACCFKSRHHRSWTLPGKEAFLTSKVAV